MGEGARRYRRYRCAVDIAGIAIELILVRPIQTAGIVYVLRHYEAECEEDLRIWLWTLAGLYATHVAVTIGRLVAPCFPVIVGIDTVAGYALRPIVLVWIIVGSVRLWGTTCDSECYTASSEVWKLMVGLLAMYYAVMGLSVVQVACIAVATWRLKGKRPNGPDITHGLNSANE